MAVSEDGTLTAVPTAPQGPTPAKDSPDGPPGFEVQDEIGHGGMGVVYRARDVALGRDVAVKVLHHRYTPDSAAARRFLHEARITGQLQHPAIPAVHQVGAFPDGRPFLAMKLIKGHTLEALLKDRSDSPADRGRLLAVFDQVCQAVAYAHAHQVIHRDLKPANVMVGAFGEVQVMDWGLAKLLDPHAESPAGDLDATLGTEIHLLRELDDATQAGSLLGTPAYMPPEQAIGAVNAIDARSDVFGLGGILCAVLTGQPPYVGANSESTRQLAARAMLDEAFARLEGCGAELELVALCRRCLAAEKEERPTDAGAVATAVAALRAAAEERARQAELERVRADGERAKAEAEAQAQRAKRRTQLAVAAGLLGLLLVGGAAWMSVRSQTAARRADADRSASVALGRAEQLAAQAHALEPGTVVEAKAALGLWEQAEAAVVQADAAGHSGTRETMGRVAEVAEKVRDGLTKARRDAALLNALETVNATYNDTLAGTPDATKRVRLFRAALTAAGLPARLRQKDEIAAMAAAIRAEPTGVQTALRATLDRLLLETPPCGDLHDGFEFTGWLEVAGRSDDHALRREIRSTCHAAYATSLADVGARPAPHAPPLPNPPVRAPQLLRLLDRAEAEDAPTDAILMIGSTVSFFPDSQANARLLQLLRTARDRRPADFRLHEWIGSSADVVWWATGNPRIAEEVLGSSRTMIALRPDRYDGYYSLGTCLAEQGEYDQAVWHLRASITRNPRFTFAYINLATALYYKGDMDGAEKVLREAVQVDPGFARAQSDLGNVLWAKGEFEATVPCFLKAQEGYPDLAAYLIYTTTSLRKTGRFEQARTIIRKWLDQAKKDDPNRKGVETALKQIDRAAAAETKVGTVLAGQDPSVDNDERVLLAERCSCLRHEAAAARLYVSAFAADPALTAFTYRPPNNDVFIAQGEKSHRYNAALAASRAGCGRSGDAGRLTPAARADLRAQALDWLRAEFAVLRKQAASAVRVEKLTADFHLRLWLVEPAFAAFRPAAARNDLPSTERAAWDKFWNDVRDTIDQARQPPPTARPVKQ
jgi:tetratricopeptide (TPR) repeat protein/tRNA A-37 threonylcarbamoyl transferase component Bud32